MDGLLKAAPAAKSTPLDVQSKGGAEVASLLQRAFK